MDRTAMLFVDGANLRQGSQSIGSNYRFDAFKLRDELTDGYYTIRSYWFDAYSEDGGRQAFFDKLRYNGYRVSATPLRERDYSDRPEQKGVDIRLATELLAQGFNDSYDTAVLATGDGDFVRAVEHVQDIGKRVVVASWDARINPKLQKQADEYIELDEIAGAITR